MLEEYYFIALYLPLIEEFYSLSIPILFLPELGALSRSSNTMRRSLPQSSGFFRPSPPCRGSGPRPLTSSAPARQERGPRAPAIWHQYIYRLGIPVERRSFSVLFYMHIIYLFRKEFYSLSIPIPFL